MIYKKLVLCLCAFILCFNSVLAEKEPEFLFQGDKSPNFFDIQKDFNKRYIELEKFESTQQNEDVYSEGMVYQFKKWEWYWKQRVLPTGEFPNPMALYEIMQSESQRNRNLKKENTLGLKPNWKILGPTNIPSNGGNGRVNGIHIPQGQTSIIWAASAGGGAWKSTNGGKTWITTTDKLGSLGVTDIATEPGNPNIVYLATGDAFGADTYFGAAPYSIGLVKSTDGGVTWSQTGLNYQQKETRALSRVLVHSTNTQIVIAAGNNGIHKSIDGGKTFSSKFSGDVKDLESKPDNPNVLYAASGSKIYKSVDAGDKWVELKTDIPSSIGRIAIAVTPADPELIYALTTKRGSWDFGGFYRSYDAGTKWELGAQSPNIIGRNMQGTDTDNQQGWYDLCIAVSPDNPDLVFVGGINIWRSTNGGNSWAINTYWVPNQGKQYVHADVHDLDFMNGSTLLTGTDGGVFQTTNRGVNWTDLSDGLEITQFYKISISQSNSDIMLGGAQDNGSSIRQNDGKWRQVWGGDGMDNAIDPNNSTFMFASSQNGNMGRSTNGGESFSSSINSAITSEEGEWVTPIMFVPSQTPGKQSTAYAGYRDLWVADDLGFWSKTGDFPNNQSRIIMLAYAPSRANTLIASNYNAAYLTYDGGKNWRLMKLPIDPGMITSFEFHPQNDSIIWISVSGFGIKKVLQSNDAATTTNWKDISGGMPPIPVNCLKYQLNSPDRLYAGTDIGVYYRDNSTKVWIPYNEGLPNVVVTDMDIQKQTNKLRIGTYGRGAWEADLVNCPELLCNVTVQGNTSFCEGDSVVLTAQSGFSDYTWSNGAKTPSITVKTSGNYSVTVYDINGCPSGNGPYSITMNTRRIPTIISENGVNAICNGDSITIDAGASFDSYKWSTGDTTRKIRIGKAGDYIISATNKLGCTDLDTITIKSGTYPDKPIVTVTNDTLYASNAYSYQWQLEGKDIVGATSAFYKLPKFSNIRKYSVKVLNEAGCSTISEPVSISSVDIQANDQGFILYPNPATTLININLPSIYQQKHCLISITSMVGNTMADNIEYQMIDSGLTIPLPALIQGQYWITLKFESGQKVVLPFVKY